MKPCSFTIFLLLIAALVHGFRPVVGPAWYAGGAGIPVLGLVIFFLLWKVG